MSEHDHTWAIVLAAGDGKRLQSLTADPIGRPVPKQYCSLFGGSTLLQDALQRGLALAPRKRLCTVVATQHAEWWRDALWALPTQNVIAQPENRGTAVGVLLSLLTVQELDPLARIVFFPADHFVAREDRLQSATRAALAEVERTPAHVILVGIKPDAAEPDLGYIVPRAYLSKARRVVRFVEKPPAPEAAALVDSGALWNSFIFAATGATLLALFRERMPDVVDAMAATRLSRRPAGLAELYRTLPEVDLARDVLTGIEPRLSVVSAHGCGWTDLGTPARVGAVVRRRGARHGPRAPGRAGTPAAPVNLAAAWWRPHPAGRAAGAERPS
jgi:mannose-1-phosphate guanylyltransferase